MKTKVPVQEWAPPREAGMIQNIEAKSISRTTGKDEGQNSHQKVRAGWFLGYNWKRLWHYQLEKQVQSSTDFSLYIWL